MEIYTTKDVAKILHIHPDTARKMFHSKNFPKIKGVGRKLLVEKETFEKFIKNEEYQIK